MLQLQLLTVYVQHSIFQPAHASLITDCQLLGSVERKMQAVAAQ